MPTDTERFSIKPIAVVESPFKEKFGIPRQPGLVPAAEGYIRLIPPYDDTNAIDGLSDFSHIWVSFIFHTCVERGWKPKVRPPRLGGNKEVGVFASRSPFRPNNIGLSVLSLLDIDSCNGLRLKVGGLDLLDGTPVIDIKPYVSYSDAIPDACSGFAPTPPEAQQAIVFSPQALAGLEGMADPVAFRQLLEQVLILDPRPAYRRGESSGRVYGMCLSGYQVRWQVSDERTTVLEIAKD